MARSHDRIESLRPVATRGLRLAALPLALALSACTMQGPADEAPADESAAVSNCVRDPSACNPPPDPCEDVCDGTACKVVRVGKKSCTCSGPCGGGLACVSGSCTTPPPTCTGPVPQYREWWVPGAHEILFDQLAPGQAPNPDTSCYSGCGPTAWAMFFASVDSHWRPLAQSGQAPWWTSNPSWFAAPPSADGTIQSTSSTPLLTMDISHHLGTSCSSPFGNGAYTEPTWMASAFDYLTQGPEAQYSPHGPLGGYTASGFNYQYDTHNTDDSLLPDYNNLYGTLDYARDWIINHGYPVVYGYYVGAAVVSNAHYGLATGYREKATGWYCEPNGGNPYWRVTSSDNTQWQFYINGGGGDTDDWRSPAAYYVGTIKIDRQ